MEETRAKELQTALILEEGFQLRVIMNVLLKGNSCAHGIPLFTSVGCDAMEFLLPVEHPFPVSWTGGVGLRVSRFM